MRPIYLFIHIPRTGGTTLGGHLYKHLKWDLEYVDMSPWGNEYRKRHNIPPLHEWYPADLDKIRIIGGHDVNFTTARLFRNREARFITILRDPARRLESMYNFYLCGFEPGEPYLEFWDWYERTQGNNSMLARLSDKGVADMEHFWKIGITENLKEFIRSISIDLEIDQRLDKSYRQADYPQESSIETLFHPDKRKLRRLFVMPRGIEAEIRKRNEADCNLYNTYKGK